MIESQRSIAQLSDGSMTLEHHGPADAPIDVLFLHANGMNAATYRDMFSALPPDIHVVAVDQRGHGATTLPPADDATARGGWSDLRDDLLNLLSLLPHQPVLLAGHSMGATVCLMAASAKPVAKGLLLLDPVWTRPGDELAIAEVSRNRRRAFRSKAEAFERLQGRGVFAGWPDQALSDYLDTGMRGIDEGFELSCTPEWETSNFLNSVNSVGRCLDALDVPAMVLTAGVNSAWQPPSDAAISPTIRSRQIADATHFFPVVSPGIARDAIVEAVHGLRNNRYCQDCGDG